VASARAVLEQTRREVIAELRNVPPERFRAFFLKELQGSIDQKIAALEQRLKQELAPRIEAALQAGRRSALEPAAVLEVSVPLTDLPQNLVDVVQGFTADLIKRISDETRARINADLAVSILRGDSILDAGRRIGRSLGSRGTTFGAISNRAETIARTEILRAYAVAQQASFRQMADYVPKLKKQWIASLDDRVRPAHRQAHGQTRDWDEPFTVDGEDLMYPRDPGGSPGNTINCRCVSVPVLPEVETSPESPALPRRGGTLAPGELVAAGAG
jgi:SPP1 gp7 family putative phage head morphogenesis protein